MNRKDSTEVRAERISSKSQSKYPIPDALRSRLRLELGRPSFLERVAEQGVAPHHAGLTPLEQHVVERLIAARRVLTVVATPTLAQGVNLPLDVSIVTFTKRRNVATKRFDSLSESDVQNMLGRAGRAGYVPDGLCLVALDESNQSPPTVLKRNRRWFFAQPATQPAPGVVALLRRALEVGVHNPGWLDTMQGLQLPESQTLLTLVARRILVHGDYGMEDELERYPSYRALPALEQKVLADMLSGLGQSVAVAVDGRAPALEILSRCGLPIAFVHHVVDRVRAASSDDIVEAEWWDDVVVDFLESYSALAWVVQLCGVLKPTGLLQAVEWWRRGAPIGTVETQGGDRTNGRANRIKIGEFLNHNISLIAQLWGIAPLVVEFLEVEGVDPADLRPMAACLRDGVPNVDALIWLRALGGLDRVLATDLAAHDLLPDETSYLARRRHASDLLDSWEATTDGPLEGEAAVALRALLDEGKLLGMP